MKIALIGASELAIVISAFFKRTEIDTLVFDSNLSLDEVTVKGHYFPNDTLVSIHPLTTFKENFDYIFIFTPIVNNAQIVPLIKKYSNKKTIVLSFTENLNDDELINELFPFVTKSAVCHFRATKKNNQTILLTTNPLDVKLHAFDISSPNQLHQNELLEVKNLLDHIGQTKIVDGRMNIKWSQAIFLVSVDRLARALNCQYGDIFHHPDALLISIHLADEIVRIAQKSKILLSKTTRINYNQLRIDSDTKKIRINPHF